MCSSINQLSVRCQYHLLMCPSFIMLRCHGISMSSLSLHVNHELHHLSTTPSHSTSSTSATPRSSSSVRTLLSARRADLYACGSTARTAGLTFGCVTHAPTLGVACPPGSHPRSTLPRPRVADPTLGHREGRHSANARATLVPRSHGLEWPIPRLGTVRAATVTRRTAPPRYPAGGQSFHFSLSTVPSPRSLHLAAHAVHLLRFDHTLHLA